MTRASRFIQRRINVQQGRDMDATPDPAEPGLDVKRLYEAVRPEYREAGAGGDGYNPDVLARRAAERIAARLRAATPDPAEPEYPGIAYRCANCGIPVHAHATWCKS